jgi:hypothetical protein
MLRRVTLGSESRRTLYAFSYPDAQMAAHEMNKLMANGGCTKKIYSASHEIHAFLDLSTLGVMLLGWYLKYGISLAATGLLLVVATQSPNNPPATTKRYDLDVKSGTFIGPFESKKPRIQQRSNDPFGGHDYIISTHQLSYSVQAAGRLLYGVSSSLAQTPTNFISAAPSAQTTATMQAGQGSTIALAPPIVTTALTNSSGTNVITSFTSEIEVRLKCNLDATFCSKVANAFGSAISQLGQVLRVKNRIV